jgi:isoleucyl-tRNA synthetase
MTVLLDTTLDEVLRREGLARELINRIQNLRKQADLDVSQRIALTLACGGELAAAAQDPALAELIKVETLAESLDVAATAPAAEHQAQDRIDEHDVTVALTPRGRVV